MNRHRTELLKTNFYEYTRERIGNSVRVCLFFFLSVVDIVAAVQRRCNCNHLFNSLRLEKILINWLKWTLLYLFSDTYGRFLWQFTTKSTVKIQNSFKSTTLDFDLWVAWPFRESQKGARRLLRDESGNFRPSIRFCLIIYFFNFFHLFFKPWFLSYKARALFISFRGFHKGRGINETD